MVAEHGLEWSLGLRLDSVDEVKVVLQGVLCGVVSVRAFLMMDWLLGLYNGINS
jgi:hypothetical protein